MGMYGALSNRYQTAKISAHKEQVWLELLPFLNLGESVGVKALSEYIVFKETPEEADRVFLAECIHEGLNLTDSEQKQTLFRMGGHEFEWGELFAHKPAETWLNQLLCRIEWKIGRPEVQELFHDLTLDSNGTENELCYSTHCYAVCCKLVFLFSSGFLRKPQLTRVKVVFFDNRPDDATVERKHREILEDLVSRQGVPSKKIRDFEGAPEEFRQSGMSIWRLDDSLQVLSYGLRCDQVGESSSPVSLLFGHLDDPVVKNWVALLEDHKREDNRPSG
jgi:hypothetical protein